MMIIVSRERKGEQRSERGGEGEQRPAEEPER